MNNDIKYGTTPMRSMIFIPAFMNLVWEKTEISQISWGGWVISKFDRLITKIYVSNLPAFLWSGNVPNDILKCKPPNKHGFGDGKYKMFLIIWRLAGGVIFWLFFFLNYKKINFYWSCNIPTESCQNPTLQHTWTQKPININSRERYIWYQILNFFSIT